MASDDNVVRLKHLQPLANGISIPNGDNVVKLKHLVSLASAIADEAPSQQPVLTLGSWSAADSIYSAEIFYDGDGTISTDIGSISNGVLTVEDEDGCFSGTLTISTNSNFNGPIPALIDSFSITPNEITVGTGTSTTAEIQITTSPGNIPYQISIPDAPDWISIDDTTIIFAPPDSVTLGNYVFTVVATTKDDQAEFAVTLNVEEKKPKETVLTIVSVGAPAKNLNSGDTYISQDYEITFTGPKDGRTLKISGTVPIYTNASTSTLRMRTSYSSYTYDPKKDISSMIITIKTVFSGNVAMKTGSGFAAPSFTILESENYKESSRVPKSVNDPVSSYSINAYPEIVKF